MELQKINVKFFVAEPDGVSLPAFIDIFHSWIQATDGIYYDVADYSHMRAGPGIILVAHDANVGIDETGGRRGLLYNQKRALRGSNREKLAHVFRRALQFCRDVEKEPALESRLKFRANEALLTINDRLLAPNTDQTFQAIKADLEGFASQLYGGAAFSLERDPEPTGRFNVSIKAAVPFGIAELLQNLQVIPGDLKKGD